MNLRRRFHFNILGFSLILLDIPMINNAWPSEWSPTFCIQYVAFFFGGMLYMLHAKDASTKELQVW
jgi:hypothetical protein